MTVGVYVLVADGVLEGTGVDVGVRLRVTNAVRLAVLVGPGVLVGVGDAVTVYPTPESEGEAPLVEITNFILAGA